MIYVGNKECTYFDIIDFAVTYPTLQNEHWTMNFRLEALLNNRVIGFSDWFNKLSCRERSKVICKIFESKYPDKSIKFLHRYGYACCLFPFLGDMFNIAQDKTRSKNLYDHVFRALKFVSELVDDKWIRLATFLHDIGKIDGTKNHEYRGSKEALSLMKGFGFSDNQSRYVSKLILYHHLPHNFQRKSNWSDRSVSKFVNTVGGHNLAFDLCWVAVADKMSSQGPNTKYINPYFELMSEIANSCKIHTRKVL